MAVHSKIYLQAKRNYREGLWNEERLRTLVAAGRLTGGAVRRGAAPGGNH